MGYREGYGSCWNVYKPKHENMRIVKSEEVQNLGDCSLRVFVLTMAEREGLDKGLENKEDSEPLPSKPQK